MTTTRIALSLLTALLVSACSSTDVRTDYNPRANFASYQQYSWSEDSGADKSVSPFIAEQVKSALKTRLDSGLYKLRPDGADFLVRYYIAQAANTIDRSPRLGIGLGSFSGNFGLSTSVGVPLGKDKVNRNVQILIDLLDGPSKALSWRGSLVIELDDQDPKVNQARIDSAVGEIWSQFPPR